MHTPSKEPAVQVCALLVFRYVVCKGFNKENAGRVFVVYFGVWLFWLLVNRILCDQLSTMDAYA